MEQDNVTPQKSPKPIRAFASIIIFLALFLFFNAIFSLIAYFIMGLPNLQGNFTLTQYFVFQTAAMLGSVLPAFILLKYCDFRPFTDLGLSFKGRWKDFSYGLLAAIFLYGIGFGISLALGQVSVVGVHLDPIGLIGSFGICILISLGEEVMTRGYILGRLLRTRINKFLALGISSVIFSFMHFFNPNVAFLPMLNLALAGCLLGVAFIYTRNLWFSISLHLFWNWLQGPVLGYKVSGIELCPSLLQLQFPENNILNGGTFGFEGSIICTALMILMTGGIIWYFERKKKSDLDSVDMSSAIR